MKIDTEKILRETTQKLRERFSKRWVIVLQMGKVGSKSVVTTLRKRMIFTPVFHVHVLSECQAARMQQLMEQGIEVRRHRTLVKRARLLRPKLVDRSGPRKKIISLVRDPVAQSIATTMSEFLDDNPGVLGYEGEPGSFEARPLHEFYRKRQEYEYDFIAPWFDSEIRDVFGIDVFAKPFPVERGYDIYTGEDADLLVMRLEDLDRCFSEAMRSFLGLRSIKLIGVNKAGDKGTNYSRTYTAFKNTVALPDSLLDKLYTMPWVKHFYSNAEIERFRTQWQAR